jgi:dihydroorotate dehydrogenase
MKYTPVRDLLFLLPPESAHRVSLRAMAMLERLRMTRLMAAAVPDDPVTVMGIRFRNRVGLAAGLDKDATCIDGLAAFGFGFVEVGTVTPRAQPGNPSPRLFRLPEAGALINRMGFNNAGVERLVEHVRGARFDGVLGINIGKNATTPVDDALADYQFCMRAAYPVASYIVVNISSPNTPGLRNLQQQQALPDLLTGLRLQHDQLKAQHGKHVPLVVKISPDMDDEEIVRVATSLADFQVDGVIVTNTTISRHAVTGLRHGDETGGLSGAPLRDQSNHALQLLAREVGTQMAIIGVGGIMAGADAAEKIRLGADLVQLYTGFIYAGPDLIRACVDAMAKAGIDQG